jgi:hypothetical protein
MGGRQRTTLFMEKGRKEEEERTQQRKGRRK